MDSVVSRLIIIILVTLFIANPLKAGQIKAVTELFYPYQSINEQNELYGYSVDVVRAVAEITGDDLDIDLLPWSVAYHRAMTTPNTLIFSIGRNNNRESNFEWVGKLAREELYFWTSPNNKISASTNLDDFRSLTITVVKEATTHQYFRERGFENLYVMGGTESNADEVSRIEMVINGRADIVIADQRSIGTALAALKYPKSALTKVFRASDLDSNLYMAFSAGSDPDTVAKYKTAFQKLESSGALGELATKWDVAR